MHHLPNLHPHRLSLRHICKATPLCHCVFYAYILTYKINIVNIFLKEAFESRFQVFLIFFKKLLQIKNLYVIIPKQLTNGPLVKRLRHGPLKAETWVRFPYGSPKRKTGTLCACFFFLTVHTGPNRTHL